MSARLPSGRRGKLRLVACVLSGLMGSAAVCAASGVPLTEQEARGRQVYTMTTSASGGEITVLVPASSMEMPGEAMPCINCHGADGMGRPESDVVPTNITWRELTKPYPVRLPGGRERPPYDEDALRTAITRGVDPAGRPLAPTMPVYTMPDADLTALIAYLKRLGVEGEAGVTDSVVRLGTLLPSRGRFGGLGQAMEAMLRASLSEVNKQGGVYSRTFELEVVEVGDSPRSALEVLKRVVEGGGVFALLAPFVVGIDREMALWANAADLPVVGPYTLFPLSAESLNRSVFYLFAGLRDQARAFLDFASGRGDWGARRAALLAPEDGLPSEDLDSIRNHARRLGFDPFEVIRYASGRLSQDRLARDLKTKDIQLVLFYGSRQELETLLAEGDRRQWRPRVFLSGSQGGLELFRTAAAFSNPLFLAYPMLPSDETRAGSEAISRLMDGYQLPRAHLNAQLTAFCAARVLLEGLKSTGRNLTRRGFVESLERLHDFDTGLTPKLSYGPNRRIGALGAYIVRVDAEKSELTPVGGWVTPSGF